MAFLRKKSFKFIFSIFLVLGLIIAALLIWLYRGELTETKIKIFQNSFLPMAFVSGQPVLMKDYILRVDLAQKLLSEQPNRQQIADQLIYEEELSQLAVYNRVYPTSKQIDAEFDRRAKDAGDDGQFLKQLASYGLNADQFKQQIILPELEKINLEVWFNGQRRDNEDSYDQANKIFTEIKQGDDFAVLAAINNMDPAAKTLHGDLGFVEVTSLLPELQETVDTLKPQQVVMLPSRSGLNVIKLEDKVGNQLHLRQIYIPGGNFDGWLNSQIKNFKIKILIAP